MFRGITAVNLDNKGRIAIPTRYRADLQRLCAGHLIITIDSQSNCLLLYPLPEWELIEDKLQALPSFNPTARRIQRLLIGHATEADMDTNGRVLIPSLLREHANMAKMLTLIGQGKKFEIWDDQQWQASRSQWIAQQQTEDDDTLLPALQDLSL